MEMKSAPTPTSGTRLFDRTSPFTFDAKAGVVVLIAALIAVRLVLAATLPLAGDEALYWVYSKHLAPGFVDHPFMNPLMIRIGTTLFGDTELGVRFMAVLLVAPATWCIWRSAEILFGNPAAGATAALLFNLTLAIAVGSIIATSDMVVMFTSSLLLFTLVKIDQTGRGQWWLAAGAAFGLGMCSKYTTAFFAVGILAWLALIPERRKWLYSPWAWAGGIVAALLFSPVFYWNVEHHWASFDYQTNRMVVRAFTLRYVAELIGAQLMLLSPSVLVLGIMGLALRGQAGSPIASTRILITTLIAPMAFYFLWHSLHERVQGNWPEAMYPAYIMAATAALYPLAGEVRRISRAAVWAKRCAAPISLTIAAAVFLQAGFGVAPLGKLDPAARILAVDIQPLVRKLDKFRTDIDAPVFVTTDYTLLSWLAFYLPTKTPIVQINERVRWVDAPAPDPKLFEGSMLYVCKAPCPYVDDLKRSFEIVDYVGAASRKKNGALITAYSAYKLAKPVRAMFDPVYPPMNLGGRTRPHQQYWSHPAGAN